MEASECTHNVLAFRDQLHIMVLLYPVPLTYQVVAAVSSQLYRRVFSSKHFQIDHRCYVKKTKYNLFFL